MQNKKVSDGLIFCGSINQKMAHGGHKRINSNPQADCGDVSMKSPPAAAEVFMQDKMHATFNDVYPNLLRN